MLASAAWAQSRDRGDPGGLGGSYHPRFGVQFVSPQVHKWYAPRHLQETYWRPWYQAVTPYAREPYTRYVGQLLEGDDFYDIFGSPIGRGWQVYSWTQAQPQAQGSQIVKQPTRRVRNTSEALAFAPISRPMPTGRSSTTWSSPATSGARPPIG